MADRDELVTLIEETAGGDTWTRDYGIVPLYDAESIADALIAAGYRRTLKPLFKEPV